ncbi:hypothetical protein FNF29_03536 [Cafeteria roenbergensis]|uniref:SMP-30/Gluconolactonase/LRE-like region domain-containing protein n=1 Tax=Cafeteria roenbergensis TaxID=33653 RepID=A0A5A8CJ17_CAFRO|nr:hypothetical protein FNF29_03536 [Cafeteria roenbergensis]|eukprot:KAA0153016.1 hypothetical protein FNF29_03536 [Cafeteria roenbergensis]
MDAQAMGGDAPTGDPSLAGPGYFSEGLYGGPAHSGRSGRGPEETGIGFGRVDQTLRAPDTLMDTPSVFDLAAVGTLAGSGKPGYRDGELRACMFDGPRDACALPDGSLLVADDRNNCLRRVHINPFLDPGFPAQTVSTLDTGAFLGPRSPVVVDGGSGVLVCDSGHNKIRLIQLNEPSLTGDASPAAAAAGAGAGRGHAKGTVRASDDAQVSDAIVAGSGRRAHRDGAAPSAAFNGPSGLAVLDDGSVLVADSGNHCIRRIAPRRSGGRGLVVTTVAGRPPAPSPPPASTKQRGAAAASARAQAAAPAAATPAGQSHNLRATSAPRSRQSSARGTPAAPSRGAAGRAERARLARLGAALGVARGGGHRDGAGDEALFNSPTALLVDPSGLVYVADTGNHCIRALHPPLDDGTDARSGHGSSDEATRWQVTTVAGTPRRPGDADGPAAEACFSFPLALVASPDGALVVADAGNASVRCLLPLPAEAAAGPDVVSPFAELVTVAGGVRAGPDGAGGRGYLDGPTSKSQFRRPTGLCMLPGTGGCIAVCDETNSLVRILLQHRTLAHSPPGLAHALPAELRPSVAVMAAGAYTSAGAAGAIAGGGGGRSQGQLLPGARSPTRSHALAAFRPDAARTHRAGGDPAVPMQTGFASTTETGRMPASALVGTAAPRPARADERAAMEARFGPAGEQEHLPGTGQTDPRWTVEEVEDQDAAMAGAPKTWAPHAGFARAADAMVDMDEESRTAGAGAGAGGGGGGGGGAGQYGEWGAGFGVLGGDEDPYAPGDTLPRPGEAHGRYAAEVALETAGSPGAAAALRRNTQRAEAVAEVQRRLAGAPLQGTGLDEEHTAASVSRSAAAGLTVPANAADPTWLFRHPELVPHVRDAKEVCPDRRSAHQLRRDAGLAASAANAQTCASLVAGPGAEHTRQRQDMMGLAVTPMTLAMDPDSRRRAVVLHNGQLALPKARSSNPPLIPADAAIRGLDTAVAESQAIVQAFHPSFRQGLRPGAVPMVARVSAIRAYGETLAPVELGGRVPTSTRSSSSRGTGRGGSPSQTRLASAHDGAADPAAPVAKAPPSDYLPALMKPPQAAARGDSAGAADGGLVDRYGHRAASWGEAADLLSEEAPPRRAW